MQSQSARDFILAKAGELGADITKKAGQAPGFFGTRANRFDHGISVNIFNQVAIVIGTTGGLAFLKATKEALIQWMKNHGGRSITIKSEGVSVTIKGENDVDRAIEAIEKLKQIPVKKARKPPRPKKNSERN